MAKPYNYIYEQLVKSEDDVAGIISYSVYKRQKMKFIQDFKKTHGCDPSEAELKPFLDISTSPQQLEFYKSESTVLTEKFLSHVLADDLNEREVFFL
ncbi:hypothetical protein ABK905_17105 [Acerihabitans sp. KWT182]|uniref:Uncharacterized protein n=1 Tax=Acerihabitans sp. KWT182 TaxID=3157919 RepID=A0AAU7Q5V3_9GAMM